MRLLNKTKVQCQKINENAAFNHSAKLKSKQWECEACYMKYMLRSTQMKK